MFEIYKPDVLENVVTLSWWSHHSQGSDYQGYTILVLIDIILLHNSFFFRYKVMWYSLFPSIFRMGSSYRCYAPLFPNGILLITDWIFEFDFKWEVS